MKKLLFVINPYAGTKKAGRHLAKIVDVFNRGGYDVTVHVTAGPGDCARAVARMAADVDLVVCCGGDGTFNETVTGILQSGENVPVGYIPAGSTNDFARSLELETAFDKAAQKIVDGECYHYDIGQFGARYFTYVASFGAFTKASYATPQNMKNLLGHTAYVLEGLGELGKIKPIHMRLDIDGTVVEDDFLFGAVCNTTSMAGILTLDPERVDMADGLFEVLLIRPPKDLGELTRCVQALTKQTYDSPMVTFCSAKQVKVVTEMSIPWSLDGEKEEGMTEITMCNLQHAIRLVK